MNFEKLLSGGDLRSIGKCEKVIAQVRTQKDFDNLFAYLFHADRLVVMRAADALEKITRVHPEYLAKHKKEMFALFASAGNKELKWHIPVMMARLEFSGTEFKKVWKGIVEWLYDKNNSKLVRVGALQGLYEMAKKDNRHLDEFLVLTAEIKKENIASVNARLRNILKEIDISRKEGERTSSSENSEVVKRKVVSL